MSAAQASKKPAKPAASSKGSSGFTAEERAAMRERSREMKAAKSKAAGEADLLAKVTEMQETDRVMAERLHALVKATAPDLSSRTWYGMPAYARDDKIVCWFQPAEKFKTRYATLGFSDRANLDDGAMWPISYALTKMTSGEETRIAGLIKQALA